jgi:allophanate hydrolase subunit 1
MMKSRYSPVLETVPPVEGVRKKIIFRTAGDGWLQEEYGDEQVFDLMDTFRLFTLMDKLQKVQIPGLIEFGNGFRTMTYRYDPKVISARELIKYIIEIEESIGSVEEMSFKSRIVELPIVFEDSVTRAAIEKYKKEIRPDTPNIVNGHNLRYVAMYNGITPEELKEKVLGTEWLLSHQLFWPGGTYQLPIDPRSSIEAPKYNPSRTYTPEGTVGLGGWCLYIYTTESPGGYQLLGRTIPTYQASQRHPAFKDKPFLLMASDRIKYVETTEDKLLEIYKLVHEEASSKYQYKITESVFKVKDWLNFINREDIKAEVREFEKRKREAQKVVKVP